MYKKLLVLLATVLVCCVVSESFALDIYTIKKDRVDQEVTGNRGYLMGNVPEYNDQRDTKRTLIAVDIELPSGTEATEMDEDAVDPVKEKCPVEESVTPEKTTVIEEDTEEYWIK